MESRREPLLARFPRSGLSWRTVDELHFRFCRPMIVADRPITLLALRQPAWGGHDQREDCPRMSRQYEAVYVFDSQLEDNAINDRLGRFHALLGSAEDMQVNHWGRRQLAFPIKRRESGYYVVARFGVESEVLPEYERAIKLDDGILRHLLTLYEHEVGAPPMSEEELAAANRRREADEDEDEE